MQSSVIVSDVQQADGRRDITEAHVLNSGRAVRVNYLAPHVWDANARLIASATEIEAQDADEASNRIAFLLWLSMRNKTNSYLTGLTNLQLSNQVGLTVGEIVVFRATTNSGGFG